MRFAVISALLLATSLSGCLSFGTDPEPGVDNSPPPAMAQMPNRQFEPVLEFDVNYLEFEKGDNVVLTWDVTDLHDYPFPLTFIDWSLKFSGAANPVAEGDGNDLPGFYEKILYKEAFHSFTLTISDGQGFSEEQEIIVKVGDPVIQTVQKVAKGGGGAVYEPMTIDVSIDVDASCSDACAFGTLFGHSTAARACEGMQLGINGIGCAWVPLPHSAAGATFTVSAVNAPDVKIEFLDACKPGARKVGDEWPKYIDVLSPTQSGQVPVGAQCVLAWPRAADPASQDTPAVHILVDEFQNAVSGHIPFLDEPRLQFIDGPLEPCAGDAIALAYGEAYDALGYHFSGSSGCPGLLAGPYSGQADGIWLPIDERYEGASIAATHISYGASQTHTEDTDSDCYFLDHMYNIVGDANNEGGPCQGTVPPGAHWVFAYQWDVPAYSMQVDFVLDAGKSAAAETLGRPVGETLMADYEDKGKYLQHKETGVCYMRTPGMLGFNGVPGVFYNADFGWYFQEANGIPGLQIDEESPYPDQAADGGGVRYTASGCVGGDMTVL